jgi:hypothetical protein
MRRSVQFNRFETEEGIPRRGKGIDEHILYTMNIFLAFKVRAA